MQVCTSMSEKMSNKLGRYLRENGFKLSFMRTRKDFYKLLIIIMIAISSTILLITIVMTKIKTNQLENESNANTNVIRELWKVLNKSSSNKSSERMGCPSEFPNIETHHEDYTHGDVCRNSKFHGFNIGWVCPEECVRTENKAAPWCQSSNENNSPCRVKTKVNIFGCSNNKISLKSYHGKYVVAESNGDANANRVKKDVWEIFTVGVVGPNTVSLKSHHGKYLGAEDRSQSYDINANRRHLDAWAIFTVEKQQGGTIALKTAHGRYVVAERDGRLRGDRTAAQEWERFVPECTIDTIIAYWDRGGCGPNGDDFNWDWCDRNRGGPCKKDVSTNKCASGTASLQKVYGNQYLSGYSTQYQVNGCSYAYYAIYSCKD